MSTNNSWNSQDPVQVGFGGTGQSTLLIHGVVVGNTTAGVNVTTAGTDGQVLTGNSAADPSFQAIGTKSGLTAHGVVLAEGASAFGVSNAGTNGQVLIAAGSADPAFASITSTGGTITFTPGANTLNMETVGGGVPWVDVTGPTQLMVANNGYIADDGALVTFTLPATAAQGTVLKVAGYGAGGWTIVQGTGQSIKFGVVTTTTTSGSLSSTNRYDQLDLLCVVADTTWVVRSVIGNITYA